MINHNFFWQILKKDVPFGGQIADAINAKFGGFEKFKELFTNAATGVFGSGWAWLVASRRQSGNHRHAESGFTTDAGEDAAC